MPRKILVIDDEEETLEYIKTGLELNGYDVVTTIDTLKAIDIAKKEKPDMIVLDFVMSGTDWNSICSSLGASAVTKDIPVIFITGDLTPEIRRNIAQSKVYFCILKPFEISELISRIEDSLAIHSTKK